MPVQTETELPADALAIFTDYFVKNYPGPDTIIYNPKWHAPKLFRAALHAIKSSTPAQPESGLLAEAVKVKPLEWREIRGTSCLAGFGAGRSEYTLMPLTTGEARLYGIDGNSDGAAKFADADEAKAAAQVDYEARIRSALAAPAQPVEAQTQEKVVVSLGITKEWFERRAKAEADLEVGVGFSVVNMTDADIARMEVVAERALPQWAQDELARLRAIALDMQKGYIAVAELVERAQAIISTSTYPNWHASARAALATASEVEG